MTSAPEKEVLVPEGDIPAGDRPQPGPRKPREAWVGGNPLEDSGRRFSRPRIRGIDAARGFALSGMMAVHTLPAWDSSTQTVTMSYQMLAGHAAALFATLAGLSLAIITGGHHPHTGRRLVRDRWNVFFRVIIVLLLGLTVNFVPLVVYNILPYYAFFFLLAIPFLGLRSRMLFIWSVGMAIAGPLMRYIALSLGEFPTRTEEVLETESALDIFGAIMDPGTFVINMLFTGVYPAITWIAFVLLGMSIGRLDLTKVEVQIKLAFFSAVVAVSTALISDTFMKTFHGFDRIVAATPDWTPDLVMDSLLLGGEVPSTTLWWQLADGPHLNTIASVTLSGSLAAFALACFLLAERAVALLLVPFERAGAMTLTLYIVHLLLVSYIDVFENAFVWAAVQILFAMAVGVFWWEAVGQGPLEKAQSTLSKKLAKSMVPLRQTSEDITQRIPKVTAPLPAGPSHSAPVAPVFASPSAPTASSTAEALSAPEVTFAPQPDPVLPESIAPESVASEPVASEPELMQPDPGAVSPPVIPGPMPSPIAGYAPTPPKPVPAARNDSGEPAVSAAPQLVPTYVAPELKAPVPAPEFQPPSPSYQNTRLRYQRSLLSQQAAPPAPAATGWRQRRLLSSRSRTKS